MCSKPLQQQIIWGSFTNRTLSQSIFAGKLDSILQIQQQFLQWHGLLEHTDGCDASKETVLIKKIKFLCFLE